MSYANFTGVPKLSFTTPRLPVSQILFSDFVITFVILFVIGGSRIAHVLVVTFENFLSSMGPDKIYPSFLAIATGPELI